MLSSVMSSRVRISHNKFLSRSSLGSRVLLVSSRQRIHEGQWIDRRATLCLEQEEKNEGNVSLDEKVQSL